MRFAASIWLVGRARRVVGRRAARRRRGALAARHPPLRGREARARACHGPRGQPPRAQGRAARALARPFVRGARTAAVRPRLARDPGHEPGCRDRARLLEEHVRARHPAVAHRAGQGRNDAAHRRFAGRAFRSRRLRGRNPLVPAHERRRRDPAVSPPALAERHARRRHRHRPRPRGRSRALGARPALEGSSQSHGARHGRRRSRGRPRSKRAKRRRKTRSRSTSIRSAAAPPSQSRT